MTRLEQIKTNKNLRVKQISSQKWWDFELKQFKVKHNRKWTGITELDKKLVNFNFYAATPDSDKEVPLVISLQGIGAPIQYSFYQIKPILEMGFAWVGLDAPFVGSRNVNDNKVVILPQIEEKLRVSGCRNNWLKDCFNIVNEDLKNLVEHILPTKFKFDKEKIALIGVSFGTMLATFAFVNQDFGSRVLGMIGHGNIKFLGRMNPLHSAHKIESPRKYHLMLGGSDGLINPKMAEELVNKMPTGSIEIVPNVGHGGKNFDEASVKSISEQLKDWKI